MGRAARLVPALVATLLALAPAAAGGTTSTTAPATTTTVAATPPGHCGATLGPGARWLRATAPCEVALTRGATARLTLSSRYRYGPLASRSARVGVTTTSHPATGGLTGTLHGRSLGVATVTTLASAVCPAGVACPMFVLLWTLTVKVVAAPPRTASVTVSEADSGHVVTLAVGQRLVVALSGPGDYVWGVPAAGDAAVLATVSASPGRATFRAARAGSTTVAAQGNPPCFPQCLPPSVLFSVRVRVT